MSSRKRVRRRWETSHRSWAAPCSSFPSSRVHSLSILPWVRLTNSTYKVSVFYNLLCTRVLNIILPDPGCFSKCRTYMVRLTPKVWKQKRRLLELSKIFIQWTFKNLPSLDLDLLQIFKFQKIDITDTKYEERLHWEVKFIHRWVVFLRGRGLEASVRQAQGSQVAEAQNQY